MEDDNLDISCVEGRQGEGAWEGQLEMEEGNQEIQELMLVHSHRSAGKSEGGKPSCGSELSCYCFHLYSIGQSKAQS